MKTIPTIGGHPIWGFAMDFRKDPLLLGANWANRHGGIVRLRVLHRTLIAITDPGIARHILHRNPENYPRSFQYRNGAAVIGQSLLTVEGETWHRTRRMMQPAFRSDPVRDVAGVTAGCWTELEQALLERSARGEAVDMASECVRLTMDVILRALAGIRLPPERVQLFGDLVSEALGCVRQRNTSPVPIPLWVPSPNNLALRRARRALDAFLGPVVEERIRHPEGTDMLSALARARDEAGGRFTYEELLDHAKTLFAAGFETTATGMAWALCEMADHPGIADGIAEEARLAFDGGSPDRSTLDRLPLAGRVVEEVLRLHPPVYNLGRRCLKDEEVCGWHIPGGVNLLISVWGMHRGAYWGDTATQFRPDRWLPSANPPKDAYMPFAVGRHTCIGNHFALVEMRMMLALVCRRFRLSWAKGSQRPGVWPRITAAPAGPVNLRLEPRDLG